MKNIILNLIGAVALWAVLYGLCLVGSAYEDEVRCENGYAEICE